MQIYDISRELFGAKVYPGDPAPKYEWVKEIKQGDVCNLSMITACAHNATHVDAPFHFCEAGITAEEIDLNRCVGECLVISKKGKLGSECISDILNTVETRKILIKGEVEITPEAAETMVDYNLELLGVEGFTVGTEDTAGLVHKILLGKEIVIVESLDLSVVVPGTYFLIAAPVKYGHLDGAPCRAILIGKDGK